MKIELYINGERIELEDNLPFSITKAWNSLLEIKDRQSTFTNFVSCTDF